MTIYFLQLIQFVNADDSILKIFILLGITTSAELMK
jgi:hypothetical protein